MTDEMCPRERDAHRYLVEQGSQALCGCSKCAEIRTLSNNISEAFKAMASPRFMLPVPEGYLVDDDEPEEAN